MDTFKKRDTYHPSALRDSMAINRYSIYPKHSLAVTSSKRHTLGFNNQSLIPDPRPTKNSDYVKRCAKQLSEFLQAKCPHLVLSPKAFESPTVKDVSVIWDTIMDFFDPKWVKNNKNKKLEDQVPLILKWLNYHTSISKSALSAPGSTHSWPQIVIAFSWLIDLIHITSNSNLIDNTESMDLDSNDDDNTISNAKMYEWTSNAYLAYIDFDDDKCQKIDESMISSIELRQEEQKKEILNQKNEINLLDAEINDLKNQLSPLLIANGKIEEFEKDKKLLNMKLNQIGDIMRKQQKKIELVQAAKQNSLDRFEGINKEIEGLRTRVTSQTFNKEDVEKLLQLKQKLELIVYHSDVNREGIENEVSQKEIQIEEVYGKLEQIIYEYNVLIHKLKLIPMESKRAKNIDYAITIDREANSIENICTTDHKGIIQKGLLGIKNEYGNKCLELEKKIKDLEDKQLQMEQQIIYIQTEGSKSEEQLNKIRALRKQLNLESIEAQKRLQKKLASIEKEVLFMKNKEKALYNEAKNKLNEKELEYQTFNKECEMEEEKILSNIKSKLEIMNNIKHTTEQTMNELYFKLQETEANLHELMKYS